MEVCGITQLGTPDAQFPEDKIKELGIDSYTLKDIEDAIRQPLRDYRDQFEGALLRSDVLEISDLHVGDQLSGTVRNVVDFGAFVDIGLHEDGLVHISHMSMKRVSHPSEVVSVNDIVKVWVYEIDEERGKVKLKARDEAVKAARENRKNGKGRNNRNNNNNNRRNDNRPAKKQPEKVTMEDATKRLLERFGNKH